ncbi:MAG: YlmC/YmxH family sporulation protein [Firmicutes bacterium]|nr:YlmC/YmxH family sporulation protein [Bacillota bacterium]NMB02503.1 YlmC/YmxH family sporulation protein [Bacillota bacterium]
MVKISDLRNRDVVNVVDGRRLGVIYDLDLDLENGRIAAIIIPGQSRLFNLFGGAQDYVIPWEKIVKIGVDTILVELSEPVRYIR